MWIRAASSNLLSTGKEFHFPVTPKKRSLEKKTAGFFESYVMLRVVVRYSLLRPYCPLPSVFTLMRLLDHRKRRETSSLTFSRLAPLLILLSRMSLWGSVQETCSGKTASF